MRDLREVKMFPFSCTLEDENKIIIIIFLHFTSFMSIKAVNGSSMLNIETEIL
jgi:hypothetical protein